MENIFLKLIPKRCQCCKALVIERLPLCVRCYLALSWQINTCLICAIKLPGECLKMCGQCLQQLPLQQKSFAALEYSLSVKHWVLQLKFYRQCRYGYFLGNLLADYLVPRLVNKPEIIIPVPLHRKRLRERGFNQAELIADSVGQRLRIPVIKSLVKRIKPTIAQTGLKAWVRHKNLQGAFYLRKSLSVKSVAIVDDVYTTGATTQALAYCLKNRGVKNIQVWCVARAN
ncbi:MAG: ComF family protein [Gammaproteobacteria bacterium]|nr:ComF family protein [Gammaproteobacteria bacterium]